MCSLSCLILDTLETIIAASAAANVKCSECAKNCVSAEIFACRQCTTDELLTICALCAMKSHQGHGAVQLGQFATAEQIRQTQYVVTHYHNHCRTRAAGIKSELELAQTTLERFVHVSSAHFGFIVSCFCSLHKQI